MAFFGVIKDRVQLDLFLALAEVIPRLRLYVIVITELVFGDQINKSVLQFPPILVCSLHFEVPHEFRLGFVICVIYFYPCVSILLGR